MMEWTYSSTNGIVVERKRSRLRPDQLKAALATELESGGRLALAHAVDEGDWIRLVYVIVASDPDRRTELEVSLPSERPVIESLATLSFPASRFEREFHDLFGVVIEKHPLARRLVRHGHWPASWYPMRHNSAPPNFAWGEDPGYPFVPVEGPGVYEIPVGPIHAGMIEPGHFRFYAVGETIVKLKIRLWFLHKGLEKLFEGIDPVSGITLAEKISGDTSVGHPLAYVLALEEALGITVNPEVALARSMLLEMERLYNHVADVGAMANDVGFSIANSHALALREELLGINQSVTGHRLLRGAIKVGGISLNGCLERDSLARVVDSFRELTEIILANPMVRERFAHTATLKQADALLLGALGPVARASGISTDARVGHPFAYLSLIHRHWEDSGDVLARFLVRVQEAEESAALLERFGSVFTSSDLGRAPKWNPVAKGARRAGIGLVEGWRGTIATRVEVAESGYLSRVKVVDPSWFNWPALPLAMAETIIPDFPLANKSFNLAYSGNDL